MDQILEQTDMMGFVMLMGRNPNAPNEVMTMLYVQQSVKSKRY